MFGLSIVVSRIVRGIAKSLDMDEDTAKIVGMVAGGITAFLVMDPSIGLWTPDTLGSTEAVENMRDKFLDD